MRSNWNSTASQLPAAVCRELEQAVQIAFLYAGRHTFSHLLESQESMPAPWVVRRIEEFIEANWQEPITIDRLAAEAGVSTRAIFRAFERSRGYSPMAFAKAIRLKRAREILTSGDPRVSVTARGLQKQFCKSEPLRERLSRSFRRASVRNHFANARIGRAVTPHIGRALAWFARYPNDFIRPARQFRFRRFPQSTITAVAVPLNRPLALAFVTKFMADAISNGTLRKAYDNNGLKDTPIRVK